MKEINHKKFIKEPSKSQKKIITQRKHFKLIDFIKKKIKSGWLLEKDFVYEVYLGEELPLYFNKKFHQDFWLSKLKKKSSSKPYYSETITLPNLSILMGEEKVKQLFEFQEQIQHI